MSRHEAVEADSDAPGTAQVYSGFEEYLNAISHGIGLIAANFIQSFTIVFSPSALP